MKIQYKLNEKPSPEQAMHLYEKAGLRRPKDPDRLANMIAHANVLITAWAGDELVGLLRAMTDYSFDCYLNDLAVDKAYQHQGIGRELVNRLIGLLDERVLVFLIANPEAAPFYAKLGFSDDFGRVGEPWCMVTGSQQT
ncbi:GNAT family N-acetyltransferase [Brevibacillus sp. SYP-B805]|uniref:GNAT family N-acetyltransferase n=1 Tax=Brevibacillus sp. SYP-B805 TaxID=1578199 RepID=UPI0013E9F4DE|nr:GNAT family N-acetyltransferase [Brevibacillus sp. SYP-B805]NGQ96680.1 GNAT family N-acetyltransferase [Brevibacillus sp. SYP-B805]